MRLRPADVPLLVRMVVLVRRYQRLERRRALPALAAAFDAPPTLEDRAVNVRRLTYLIDLIMKTIYRDRYCMKRSLLHFHFLRKYGYLATLHFGVRKQDDGVSGHAWVEVNGRPYAERYHPRVRFVETYRYPPNGAPQEQTSAVAEPPNEDHAPDHTAEGSPFSH